jgi:hypothetical protein
MRVEVPPNRINSVVVMVEMVMQEEMTKMPVVMVSSLVEMVDIAGVMEEVVATVVAVVIVEAIAEATSRPFAKLFYSFFISIQLHLTNNASEVYFIDYNFHIADCVSL